MKEGVHVRVLLTALAVAVPAPATPVANPVPPILLDQKEIRRQRTGCAKLYTRAQHRRYVFHVYRGSTPVTRHEHYRVAIKTKCQHSERSERISRRTWYRERRARKRILARGNAGLGFLMARERGWASQFSCLDTLWGSRESGWRTSAHNASGAHGIPQALPGDKMASAGPNWQTNPRTQIRWGLRYIAGRYGTPCGALAHSTRVGWY